MQILNRPVRVCGVVMNQGEPGGGPFWVNKDGLITKQIVESVQVDMTSNKQKEIWNSSTHFNPVAPLVAMSVALVAIPVAFVPISVAFVPISLES